MAPRSTILWKHVLTRSGPTDLTLDIGYVVRMSGVIWSPQVLTGLYKSFLFDTVFYQFLALEGPSSPTGSMFRLTSLIFRLASLGQTRKGSSSDGCTVHHY